MSRIRDEYSDEPCAMQLRRTRNCIKVCIRWPLQHVCTCDGENHMIIKADMIEIDAGVGVWLKCDRPE
jgi:hypothetical protein